MKEESTSLKKYANNKSISILKFNALIACLVLVVLTLPNLEVSNLQSQDWKNTNKSSNSAQNSKLKFDSSRDIDRSLFSTKVYRADWTDFFHKGTEAKISRDVVSGAKTSILTLSLQPLHSLIYKHNPMDGKSLFFSGKDSKIHIPNGRLKEFTDDFLKKEITIYLRINPSSQKEIFQILTKTIFRNGMEYGMDLTINNHIPELNLYRFFSIANSTSKRNSGKITSRYKLSRREWNLLTLHFIPNQNTVVLYWNDREAGRIENLNNDTIGMGFHPDDDTDLVLGKDFYGEMKDFSIQYGSPNFSEFNSNYPVAKYNPDTKNIHQNKGSAISPVYKTDYSYSFLHDSSFRINNPIPNEGLAEVWIRASLFPFSATEKELDSLEWVPLKDFKKRPLCSNLDSNLPKNCFRYYQWKTVLKSDPNGRQSPGIEELSALILQTKPPRKVVGLKFNSEKSDLKNLKACMTWIANDESNVWDGGGYTVHYGFHKNRPIGKIPFRNKVTIDAVPKETLNTPNIESQPPPERVSILQTCIDNNTIIRQAESLTLEKNLPIFRNGTTVYFWVTAENRFYSESGPGMDQISDLSEPIVVSFPSLGL